MKKRLLSIALFLSLAFVLPLSALATPSVGVWYSNKEVVGYTPYDGSYYIYNLSSNSTFRNTFQASVSHAASKWNSVLQLCRCWPFSQRVVLPRT